MTKDYLGITNNDRTILAELRHQTMWALIPLIPSMVLQPNCVSVSVRPQHSFVSVDEGAHPNPCVRLCMGIPANPASCSLFGIISLYLKLPPTLLPQTTRLPSLITNRPSTVHHYHYGNIQQLQFLYYMGLHCSFCSQIACWHLYSGSGWIVGQDPAHRLTMDS